MCAFVFMCTKHTLLVFVYILTIQTSNYTFGVLTETNKHFCSFACPYSRSRLFFCRYFVLACVWLWIVKHSCWIEIGRSGPSKWIGMMNAFEIIRWVRVEYQACQAFSVCLLFYVCLCVCVYLCANFIRVDSFSNLFSLLVLSTSLHSGNIV